MEHIRLHHAKPGHRRALREDLAWVFSDDEAWPFSFIPLCQVVGLEPEYVRLCVQRWLALPSLPGRPQHLHRHVA